MLSKPKKPGRRLADEHLIFAALLGLLLRVGGALGDAHQRPRQFVTGKHFADARAKGDETFFVAVQKKAAREFTLQADDDIVRFGHAGFGQQDDELVARKARQRVLRAQRGA